MTDRLVDRLAAARPPRALWAFRWASTVIDPIRMIGAPRGLVRYYRDLRRYRRLTGAEPIRLLDTHPCVHDQTKVAPFDAHYFFQDAWAARCLASSSPSLHVDIGGHLPFVGVASATTDIVFVDIRPVVVDIEGLHPMAADGRKLPFADRSVRSLSCLHVAEHVGLGRYGDPLDPGGTVQIIRELLRVLAPHGELLFSMPVGRPRVCFNAHRILDPVDVVELFRPLSLAEFALVNDQGAFQAAASPSDAIGADYACGLYRFVRAQSPET